MISQWIQVAGKGTRLIGGLVGYNYGSIANCYATGWVNGVNYVGSIAGANKGAIDRCYATGYTTATGGYI